MEFINSFSQRNGAHDTVKELAMVRMDLRLKDIRQFGRHGSHNRARKRLRRLLSIFGFVVR